MTEQSARTVLFISKATPGDDEFASWLAPRLEAAGYHGFADILSLDGGTRWRKEITDTLQKRAIKMLLCCSDETLARDNVQEEIGIGLDLAKQIPDPKFIIPLRLRPYKKLLGIGELQYVDFVRGWAEGLSKLIETLERQKIKPDAAEATINPNWELFRRRSAIPLLPEPERLTSNWIRVAECPDFIRHFEPSGALDDKAMEAACERMSYPAIVRGHGFFSFAAPEEINAALADTGHFKESHAINLLEFIAEGSPDLKLEGHDASNIANAMYRKAWNQHCRSRGLIEYEYSKDLGFHVGSQQAKLGQKIPWGRQGERRSSMLRNQARGHVWQFGVSGIPAFWPYHHLKLKSRVLFAPPLNKDAGEVYDKPRKQHRLRRTVCKGWRNKQWHGRLMAFLELLAGESAFIELMLSPTQALRVEATPALFTSPVSTKLPDVMPEDDEETDETTLGRPEPEPDESEGDE
jgi:TIR domain-containing protein